jgi:hypothetical protein
MIGKKRCPVCSSPVEKNDLVATIQMNTLSGLHEIQVCEPCGDFFDKSAEILQKSKRRDRHV